MNKLNDLATELFKKLINSGDKYLIKCTSYALEYKIHNKHCLICMEKSKFMEAEPIKFTAPSYSINNLMPFGCCDSLNTHKDDDDIVFTIIINNRKKYYVNQMSRLDTVLYLDKIDIIIKNWEENEFINTINFIDNDDTIPTTDTIDDFE